MGLNVYFTQTKNRTECVEKYMSFFKSSKLKEDVKQSGGSAYVNRSGCYPVNIIAAFASSSKGGSTSVDLFVEHNGQKQVIYGNLRITNNDGSQNKIGAKVFNQLMIIADVEEVGEPTEGELPIGKNGKDVDVSVLEELCDVDVMMRIQMEYSAFNGNIQEKKVIRAFFRANDNASAEEIVNGGEVGEHFKGEEKYLDNVTYKDGLDEGAITAWIKDNRPKGTANAGSGGGSSETKKPAFGKRKSFGK